MVKVGEFYCYEIPPIDIWHPLRTLEELQREAIGHQRHEDAKALERFVERAKNAIREADLGWEGDMREGPFVLHLPYDVQVQPGAVLFKHDSNGTTFVASLIPMPQLRDDY